MAIEMIEDWESAPTGVYSFTASGPKLGVQSSYENFFTIQSNQAAQHLDKIRKFVRADPTFKNQVDTRESDTTIIWQRTQQVGSEHFQTFLENTAYLQAVDRRLNEIIAIPEDKKTLSQKILAKLNATQMLLGWLYTSFIKVIRDERPTRRNPKIKPVSGTPTRNTLQSPTLPQDEAMTSIEHSSVPTFTREVSIRSSRAPSELAPRNPRPRACDMDFTELWKNRKVVIYHPTDPSISCTLPTVVLYDTQNQCLGWKEFREDLADSAQWLKPDWGIHWYDDGGQSMDLLKNETRRKFNRAQHLYRLSNQADDGTNIWKLYAVDVEGNCLYSLSPTPAPIEAAKEVLGKRKASSVAHDGDDEDAIPPTKRAKSSRASANSTASTSRQNAQNLSKPAHQAQAATEVTKVTKSALSSNTVVPSSNHEPHRSSRVAATRRKAPVYDVPESNVEVDDADIRPITDEADDVDDSAFDPNRMDQDENTSEDSETEFSPSSSGNVEKAAESGRRRMSSLDEEKIADDEDTIMDDVELNPSDNLPQGLGLVFNENQSNVEQQNGSNTASSNDAHPDPHVRAEQPHDLEPSAPVASEVSAGRATTEQGIEEPKLSPAREARRLQKEAQKEAIRNQTTESNNIPLDKKFSRFFILPDCFQLAEVLTEGKHFTAENYEEFANFNGPENMEQLSPLGVLRGTLIPMTDVDATAEEEAAAPKASPFQRWTKELFDKVVKFLKLDIKEGLWHSRTKFNVPGMRRAAFLWQVFGAAGIFLWTNGDAIGVQWLADEPGMGKSTTICLIIAIERIYGRVSERLTSDREHFYKTVGAPDPDGSEMQAIYDNLYPIDAHSKDSVCPWSERASIAAPFMHICRRGHLGLPTLPEYDKCFTGHGMNGNGEGSCYWNYNWDNPEFDTHKPWVIKQLYQMNKDDRERYGLTMEDLKEILPYFESKVENASEDEVEMVKYKQETLGRNSWYMLDLDDFDKDVKYRYRTKSALNRYIMVTTPNYAKGGAAVGMPKALLNTRTNARWGKDQWVLPFPWIPKLIIHDEWHKDRDAINKMSKETIRHFRELQDYIDLDLEQSDLGRSNLLAVSGTPVTNNWLKDFKPCFDAYLNFTDELQDVDRAWPANKNKTCNRLRRLYTNVTITVKGKKSEVLRINHLQESLASLDRAASTAISKSASSSGHTTDIYSKLDEETLKVHRKLVNNLLPQLVSRSGLSDRTVMGHTNALTPTRVLVQISPSSEVKERLDQLNQLNREQLRNVQENIEEERNQLKKNNIDRNPDVLSAYSKSVTRSKDAQISATCPGYLDVIKQWQKDRQQELESDPAQLMEDHPNDDCKSMAWNELSEADKVAYFKIEWKDEHFEDRGWLSKWPEEPHPWFKRYCKQLLCVDDASDRAVVQAVTDRTEPTFTAHYQLVGVGALRAFGKVPHRPQPDKQDIRLSKYFFIVENLVEQSAVSAFLSETCEDSSSPWYCVGEEEHPRRLLMGVNAKAVDTPAEQSASAMFANEDNFDNLLAMVAGRFKDKSLDKKAFKWVKDLIKANDEEAYVGAPLSIRVLGATRIYAEAVSLHEFENASMLGPMNKVNDTTQGCNRITRANCTVPPTVELAWTPGNYYQMFKIGDYHKGDNNERMVEVMVLLREGLQSQLDAAKALAVGSQQKVVSDPQGGEVEKEDEQSI